MAEKESTQSDYDVIIIGAGPTGCMAALQLAKTRLKILVLEKGKLPRNKSCSGVLVKKSVDIIEQHVGTFPKEVFCHPHVTNGIIITTEFGERQVYQDKGRNIWRDKFDHWLAEQARQKGVEVMEDSTVIDIAENGDTVQLLVKRNDKRVVMTCLLVLACDGVNGISRAIVGTPRPKRMITYQAFFNGHADIEPSYFYAYLDPKFSEYDAWLNIKDGLIVIGVGITKSAHAKVYLDKFIRYLHQEVNLKLFSQLKEEFWSLPVIIPNYNVIFNKGKIFFGGEAAGLLNPVGEGISCALTSGLYLGKAISESYSGTRLDSELISRVYKREMGEEVAYMKRQWMLLKEISPLFWERITTC